MNNLKTANSFVFNAEIDANYLFNLLAMTSIPCNKYSILFWLNMYIY